MRTKIIEGNCFSIQDGKTEASNHQRERLQHQSAKDRLQNTHPGMAGYLALVVQRAAEENAVQSILLSDGALTLSDLEVDDQSRFGKEEAQLKSGGPE